MDKNNWTYKKLGEVGDIITGSTPSTKEEDNYNSSDVCFVKPSDIPRQGIGFLSETEFYISRKAYNNSRKLPKGSVLTTCIGIIGKVGILNVDATCNQQINAIIPHSNISSTFLAYSILSKRHYLEHISNAPVVPIINKKEFSNTTIPIPPLAEQERIVAELDLISSVIEKKKAQLKEYDQLAQSIFYDMFGDPITNEKGWEVKKLGEIGTIVGGSTPSTNDDSNWDGTINWVTPAELGEQLYYGETIRKLTEMGARGLTMMPAGTVLLSSRAPIGKLAITTTPMCCNQGFKNIICHKIINNVFLYYYLKNTMDLVKALGRGATFKEVSKSAISSFKVILPPLPLQQEFADKVEAIERQKTLIQQSIDEVQTLFDSRMDYWFG